MSDELTLTVPGAGLRLDPHLGTLTTVWFDVDGRRIEPLHRAPWLDEADVQANEAIPPVERRLAGDFFCAPFADRSEGLPIHGWPANSPWEVQEITQTGQGATARLSLMRPVQGARVTKRLDLSAHDPLVYQTHTITGGEGTLTAAHHPMVRMAAAGWMSYSPKRRALTPLRAMEPEGGWLAYNAEGSDLGAFPGRDGPVDLQTYPLVRGHEDFVALVEAEGATLGWTVVIREAEDDLVLFLKDPRVLPLTMLWISNGGRARSPWNGRHFGVLGVEDGIAAGAEGLAAARLPNRISATGVPTVLTLGAGRSHDIRHVIGAIPRPPGWRRVVDLRADGASLRLTEANGETVVLPYRGGFFPK